MSIVTYNNRSIANISAIPGAAKTLTHIKTLTASSSGTLSFVNGSDDVVLDSTYPIYLFKFINIHTSTEALFSFNFRDGSTDYDATKTTSFFYAYHNEAGSSNGLQYAGYDLAQGTGFQQIGDNLDADNDHCLTGFLHLFNPSSTTFVKHFYGTIQFNSENGQSTNSFVAGYCNTTTAIDAAQFKMSSGNIDAGTIKLYGIKDS
jgi:hypothetical protein